MAIKAHVQKPPGIRPPAKYTPDAKRAFKQAFRDAVRENQPLSKVIELGVISGTQHNNMTPESAGTEYKSPVTKDAFRKRFADALAKGVSTTDALNAALATDETIPAKPRPTNAIVKHLPPPSLQQRQTNMQARRALRPAHVVARAYGPGVTRDAPQGYYGTVRNKGGNVTHSTGPHPSHEVAKAEAFKAAPKARTVETSRGEHGMDIRYHSR